ncbi:MAG: LolA-related protein [Methylococcales bacterium]
MAETITPQPSQWSDLLILDKTTSFRYQETRHLELLDSPWQGGGLLLASKDGTLVKLQMRPERKIMAITPGEMIYFDSETEERRRLPLSTPHPMTRQAIIFQELLQGRLDKISTDYDITFQKTAPDWTLTLTPKATHEKPVFTEIIMHGSVVSATRNIHLTESGGDSSDLAMQLLDTGSQLEFMIERLLREAIGQ